MRDVATVAAALLLALSLNTQGQYDASEHCQILDSVSDPIWSVQAGYVERADVKATAGGDFGLYEFIAQSGLIYLRTDIGDFDISGTFDLSIVSSDGGVNLPDQFGEISVDIEWTKRYDNGMALRLGLTPGVYSDFEDISMDDVFVPFRIQTVLRFDDYVSGVLGFRVYPGFDTGLDPDIGIRWAMSDSTRLDIMYPESMLTYVLSRDWELIAGLVFDKASEYQLEEKDARDRFMYRDARAYVGANRFLTEQVILTFRAGQSFDREVEFEDGGKADVQDSFYLRVGIGGLL